MRTHPVALVFLLIALASFSYVYIPLSDDEYRKTRILSNKAESVLSEKIYKNSSRNKSPIFLKDRVPFDWDYVCPIFPYTDINRFIEDNIGYQIKTNLRLRVRELQFALAFIKKDRIVAFAKFDQPMEFELSDLGKFPNQKCGSSALVKVSY